MEFLIEPLSRAFLLRGLAGGFLVAIVCSSLSAIVVWRGLSFMGDALAHSVLPGIVVAYVLGISLFWGALGAALLAVMGVGLVSSRGRLKEDAAIGVLFAGFFAFGLLLLGKIATFSDLSHILFGNILGVSDNDIILMAIATVIVGAVLILCSKEIITASFDPAHAMSIGLSPTLVRYLILVLLALATVAAIQTVGVVLVLAMLVTPGAAASLISQRFKGIMLLSVLLALLATLIGFYASYYIDAASGPAIVLALTIMFFICALIAWVKR